MSITCKFELSRSSNIYYSGEEVSGSLTVFSLKQQQIAAIILEFYGQSTVQWWELDKSKENTLHNDFSTHEVSDKTLYNHEQKHVCEQIKLDSSNCCSQLQPHVEYTFNFCFSIPQQAPATYHCRYGQTNYGLLLQMQRTKKINKDFHQRIVIKNKLDLTQGLEYKKSCDVSDHNEFDQINLQIPCNGFTPGQKIPYYFCYQTSQNECKMLIQLNCYTTCHTQKNGSQVKQLKKIICHRKHVSSKMSAYVNIPLRSPLSSIHDPELVLRTQYSLEAFLVNSHKKVLLTVTIPITIGSTPCYLFDGGLESYMCYDNFGSSSIELSIHKSDVKRVKFSDSVADQLLESVWNLPIKSKTKLRKSFRYFYKKLIKYT